MQTILVSHGALGSASQMQPVVEALRAFGGGRVRVEALELPGHGSTPMASDHDFRLSLFVEAMADAVEHLNGPPPILFGYSMGGYVGLALESRSPRTFSAIVTLGTKFDWTPESAEREALRLDPVAVASRFPKFAAQLAARHEHVGGWEVVMVRTAALLRENGRAPQLTVEMLERISVPVCIAVGTKDDTVSVQESQAMANLMLHGRFAALEDVPHPIERVPVERIAELLQPMLALTSS